MNDVTKEHRQIQPFQPDEFFQFTGEFCQSEVSQVQKEGVGFFRFADQFVRYRHAVLLGVHCYDSFLVVSDGWKKFRRQ